MFKDFEATKQQLSELAEVINKFKSEAVQMRLIELLLDAEPHDLDENEALPPAVSKKRRKKAAKASTRATDDGEGKSGARRKASGGTGPKAILTKLFNEKFFAKPQKIGDICKHSETNLARKIKPSDISGKLARMVRDGELKRKKNADGQYEYTSA